MLSFTNTPNRTGPETPFTFVKSATASKHTNPLHAQLVIESGGQRTTALLSDSTARLLAEELLAFIPTDRLEALLSQRSNRTPTGWAIAKSFSPASSVIDAMAYHREQQELVIAFKRDTRPHRGPSYTKYVGVPEWLHQDFLQADSLGSYYNAFIKGKYPAMPVETFPGGEP